MRNEFARKGHRTVDLTDADDVRVRGVNRYSLLGDRMGMETELIFRFSDSRDVVLRLEPKMVTKLWGEHQKYLDRYMDYAQEEVAQREKAKAVPNPKPKEEPEDEEIH